jgi:hypothetical protein
LAASNTDPDVGVVSYTSANKVVMPKSGADNPAAATLVLNKSSGTISGAFTLTEVAPKLIRRATYQGMLVRPVTGGVKAVGYFLLPQIPATGQTISNSPILSGKVVIDQDPSSE